ncbi:alpha/beta fold hydrolase [Streptomyces sp. AK010]|uniref:alpha/beta fold hydrolase n=1 Tax=Streptomyces sp. AK010 TaxID=2723074 RepID=UPI0017F423B3|nr:alpha/beta hydrolase [Streptomyces sp. AK010]MBB6414997.1 pimeloyl-ACP methyl ester carboxylesterase [Streptomyces sp. AK010]
MEDWTLRESLVTASGAVRWDRIGEPDGEPVVLLHGTPFSSYVWHEIASALAAVGYQVHVWDMPGYGASAMHPGQDVSLGAQGGILTELLAHWGLREPSVIAHDFGGCVALRAHLLHGARYRRLALVDPVALRPWGSPFFRLVGEHSRVFEQLPAALHEALVREYVSSASHAGLRPATLDALVGPWTTEEGRAAFYRQIAQADQRYTDEIQPLYPSIDLPVTVCWGTEDTWIPFARGQELAALIPGARLVPVPEAGHLVPLDAPARLTSELLAFLTA